MDNMEKVTCIVVKTGLGQGPSSNVRLNGGRQSVEACHTSLFFSFYIFGEGGERINKEYNRLALILFYF
jgi:hypothetical protein